jgi:hypothetical protein
MGDKYDNIDAAQERDMIREVEDTLETEEPIGYITRGDRDPTTEVVNHVLDDEGRIIGYVTHWNPHGLGECIVQYLDGSADSAIFNELNLGNREGARDYLDGLEP